MNRDLTPLPNPPPQGGRELAPLPIRLSRPWWDRGLDLLFPPRCVSCGRRGIDVCGACIAEMHPLGPAVCPRCSTPTLEGRVCARCQRRPGGVRAILAGFPFEGAVRAAVLALKYRSRTRLVEFLGSALVLPLQTRPLDVEVIVPVPLWPERRRQRGFNQSELLADRLSHECGWPVSAHFLARSRDTMRQTELPARQRWANVAGAFSLGSGADVLGRRVLLVDDVCTTGATLEACAAPLLEAGAAGVWALVVARDLPRSARATGVRSQS